MTVVRVAVGLLVAVVWAGLYGRVLWSPPGTPYPPAELSAVMLAVVGWLFSGAARDASSKGPREPRAVRRAIASWLIGEPKKETKTDDRPDRPKDRQLP